MLARLHVLMPYRVTVAEGEQFKVYQATMGDYTVRFLPPERDASFIFGRQPENLTLNGRAAFEANIMRIDFQKASFDRRSSGPIDPPEELIRHVVSDFHARLRFTTRAAHASTVSFPWNQWLLRYTNDDGSELEPSEGYVRGRGSIQFQWSFIGLSPEVWNELFGHPGGFSPPVWDSLRLDAKAALPSVGTAVVLGATALEVFISVVLDSLATRKGLSAGLWAWLRDRDGKTLQQPSVEEQFDVLLKEFAGHSLKEDAPLWEAFKNLKSARNSFVHEGVATVGGAPVTKELAAMLVSRVDAIVETVWGWLPEDLRWPVPAAKAHIAWSQKILEPDNAGSSTQHPNDGAV